MKKDGKTPDENDLEIWRRVARTVDAYAPAKRGGARKKTPAPAPEKSGRRAAVPLPAPKSAAPKAPPSAGFDSATARRLKRGKIEPEARVDLHGMTQGAAFEALKRFILSSRRRGLRTVLVITGKGKGPEGGVLRRLVPLWLEEGGLVVASMQARPEDGGAGALYVRLRKKD